MDQSNQQLLEEIRKLSMNYSTCIEGRKDIINNIREKIRILRKKTKEYDLELNSIERYYSYRDYYISDYQLVMNLILRLANSQEELYSLRKIMTTDFYQVGNSTKQLFSEVLFITDNNSMKELTDHMYYYDEFLNIATNLINNGNSLIVVTKNLFEPNVKPKKENVKCDNVFDIRNGGFVGNITCYINDSNLQESIDKLTDYININGPDFSNINEDILFDLMSKSNKYQKKLSK